MSRSIRGKKAAGYDYWSKRPHSGLGFGPDAKKRTHRTERQQGKSETREPADA